MLKSMFARREVHCQDCSLFSRTGLVLTTKERHTTRAHEPVVLVCLRV